jgi:tellurite resistance protein
MKHWMLAGLIAAVLAAGCSKDRIEEATVQEASKKTQSVFATSKDEVKADAEKLSQSLDQADFGSAIGRIESLSVRPDLSAEQREALGVARMAVMEKLREGAAAGDKQAEEILETHRARK